MFGLPEIQGPVGVRLQIRPGIGAHGDLYRLPSSGGTTQAGREAPTATATRGLVTDRAGVAEAEKIKALMELLTGLTRMIWILLWCPISVPVAMFLGRVLRKCRPELEERQPKVS